MRPPALTIVGRVVELRPHVKWFEDLPLFGQTVLVTRTRKQASELSAALAELGATVIEAPTIRIEPPVDWKPVDDALRRLRDFDWLVLTSPNGVEAMFERLAALNLDARALCGCKVAAVGPATAEALAARSICADLVPDEFTTKALAEAMATPAATASPATGKRVLLARADIAGDEMATTLRAAARRSARSPSTARSAPTLCPSRQSTRCKTVA